MKNLIFLLIPLLFLSSCTIDWNDEKDKKIMELEKQVQDDTFKKNKECNDVFEKNKEEIYGDQQEQIELGLVFTSIGFSKKINSCYVAYSLRNPKLQYSQFLIDDLLKKESIFTSSAIINDPIEEESKGKQFNNKLNELKGE